MLLLLLLFLLLCAVGKMSVFARIFTLVMHYHLLSEYDFFFFFTPVGLFKSTTEKRGNTNCKVLVNLYCCFRDCQSAAQCGKSLSGLGLRQRNNKKRKWNFIDPVLTAGLLQQCVVILMICDCLFYLNLNLNSF